MKISFTKELIAPCGMNCNVCSGYLASQYDIKKQGIRMSYCLGCRPRNKKCTFLKKRCKRLMNQTVQYCYECSEYPCGKLRDIDTRYQALFRMSLLENLTNIKQNGLKKFVETQEETWRCPTCGGTICCHNGLCFQCDIDRLRNKKKRYRWEDD